MKKITQIAIWFIIAVTWAALGILSLRCDSPPPCENNGDTRCGINAIEHCVDNDWVELVECDLIDLDGNTVLWECCETEDGPECKETCE